MLEIEFLSQEKLMLESYERYPAENKRCVEIIESSSKFFLALNLLKIFSVF